jgi:predicted MFS family arabinose efflux permease
MWAADKRRRGGRGHGEQMSGAARTQRRRRTNLLMNRNYTLFLGGAFVSALGGWMQTVALSWVMLQRGNSTFLLGVLGFVQLIPVLVLGIPAGVLADRVDRRVFLLWIQGASTVLALILAVLQYADKATVPLLLIMAAANGIVGALNGPPWQAFIKELVGPEQLRRAIAINSARFNLTRIVGPSVGGWLLVSAGAGACFAANAVSYLAVLAALLAIRTTKRQNAIPSGIVTPTEASTRAVLRNPQLRAVLFPAIGLAVLALPYGNFFPSMARDIFDRGPAGLSLLLTATGVGAVIGAFLSSLPIVARRPGRSLAVMEIITGLALAAFAWSPSFYLALLCIVVFGMAVIGYLATAGATIQLAAAPGTEGRALGLWMIVNSGLVPFGSLAIGALAEAIGVRGALGWGGIGCLLCGVAASIFARRGPEGQSQLVRAAK